MRKLKNKAKQVLISKKMINPVNFKVKPSLLRKFVTQLDKSGAILPVVLLEGTVTGGRTYQAYKRDGFVEARERVTEESLGAIFWLFGATMFGKLFDKIGQAFMKIPKNMPDVGVDIGRSPFKNYIRDMASKLKVSPEYLAKYSVGKTFASLITACLFIGYVVPKVNQAITRHIYGRMDKKDPNHEKAPNPYTTRLTIKDARSIFSAKGISINAVENFKAHKEGILPAVSAAISSKAALADTASAIQPQTSVQTQTPQQESANSQNPSFKGSTESLLRIVQNFEENDIWKLMGTDVGTVSGRTLNARNKDERVEILFRDLSSIYFYCFSMPAIMKFMNKHDSFGGLNTKLNPMSAMEVHNYMIDKMAEQNMPDKINVNTFKEFTLGKELDNELFSKFFEPRPEPEPKKYLFGLIKKKQELEPRIMKLSEFEAKVDQFAKPEDRDRLKQIARKMSEVMQPERYFDKEKISARILSESQVEDILRGGIIRDPEFMSNILNNIYKEKNNPKPLSDPYKYLPLKQIEEKKQQVIDYVKAIVKDAQESGVVTPERMLKLNKRNMVKGGLFMGLAMGVSALFLSTIIPKIQYYITFLRTGKNSFPGTEGIKENK